MGPHLAPLVSQYIEHFTYLGLFVVLILCGFGLPLPEDIALLAGGFLAHRGVTRYPITLAISFVGVIAGDNTLYFLGRHFGSKLVERFRIGPSSHRRIEQLTEFMRRHGHRTVFYARFLTGLRAAVYLSAGSLGVTPMRFVAYDLMGAIISVPLVVSLGYYFGDQIEQIIHYAGGFQRVILLVAGLSLAFYAGARVLVYSRAEKGVT